MSEGVRCRWAGEANELVAAHRGGLTLLEAIKVHISCNELLGRLRSGSRRRKHGAVRAELRRLRAEAASRIGPSLERAWVHRGG